MDSDSSSEDEVFFGPITDKEKQIAARHRDRKTLILPQRNPLYRRWSTTHIPNALTTSCITSSPSSNAPGTSLFLPQECCSPTSNQLPRRIDDTVMLSSDGGKDECPKAPSKSTRGSFEACHQEVSSCYSSMGNIADDERSIYSMGNIADDESSSYSINSDNVSSPLYLPKINPALAEEAQLCGSSAVTPPPQNPPASKNVTALSLCSPVPALVGDSGQNRDSSSKILPCDQFSLQSSGLMMVPLPASDSCITASLDLASSNFCSRELCVNFEELSVRCKVDEHSRKEPEDSLQKPGCTPSSRKEFEYTPRQPVSCYKEPDCSLREPFGNPTKPDCSQPCTSPTEPDCSQPCTGPAEPDCSQPCTGPAEPDCRVSEPYNSLKNSDCGVGENLKNTRVSECRVSESPSSSRRSFCSFIEPSTSRKLECRVELQNSLGKPGLAESNSSLGEMDCIPKEPSSHESSFSPKESECSLRELGCSSKKLDCGLTDPHCYSEDQMSYLKKPENNPTEPYTGIKKSDRSPREPSALTSFPTSLRFSDTLEDTEQFLQYGMDYGEEGISSEIQGHTAIPAHSPSESECSPRVPACSLRQPSSSPREYGCSFNESDNSLMDPNKNPGESDYSSRRSLSSLKEPEKYPTELSNYPQEHNGSPRELNTSASFSASPKFNDTLEQIDQFLKYGVDYGEEGTSPAGLSQELIATPAESPHSSNFEPPLESTRALAAVTVVVGEEARESSLRVKDHSRTPVLMEETPPCTPLQANIVHAAVVQSEPPLSTLGTKVGLARPIVRVTPASRVPLSLPRSRCVREAGASSKASPTVKMVKPLPSSQTPTTSKPQPQATRVRLQMTNSAASTLRAAGLPPHPQRKIGARHLSIKKTQTSTSDTCHHRVLRHNTVASPLAKELRNNPPPPLVINVKPSSSHSPVKWHPPFSPASQPSSQTPKKVRNQKVASEGIPSPQVCLDGKNGQVLPVANYKTGKSVILDNKENKENTRRQCCKGVPVREVKVIKHRGRMMIAKPCSTPKRGGNERTSLVEVSIHQPISSD